MLAKSLPAIFIVELRREYHGMSTETSELEKLSEPFRALIGNAGLNYQILDMLPIPIEIFAPDGTAIFINRAFMELTNYTDASLFVGKYNYNDDPICMEIMGQDVYDQVSRGEAVSFPDFPAPIQDGFDRGFTDEKPFEAATMDLFFLPIWDGDIFVCTILFYTVKNMYHGRADIAKAQEYIKEHWQDEFDIDKVARAATLSKWHFQRIFKEVTESTPFEYYQKVKIEKIKEKLLDDTLSIEQAFSSCGVDSRGAYLNLFKEKTGLSPSEYRKENSIK
jgi:AraC-like DNA-binding protein